MGKEVIRFGDIKILKNSFHCYKNSIFLNDVDINNKLRWLVWLI